MAHFSSDVTSASYLATHFHDAEYPARFGSTYSQAERRSAVNGKNASSGTGAAFVNRCPIATIIELVARIPFADQIELFHLGYGLWDENADKKWRCSGQPALAEVE
jgi:hypothetical protein